VEVNIIWETIREDIKISAKVFLGYYEFKKQKPWFDERSSKLIDQRKQVKLWQLQNPSKVNVNNLKSAIFEASRHVRNK
jgi:hypothetical protein